MQMKEEVRRGERRAGEDLPSSRGEETRHKPIINKTLSQLGISGCSQEKLQCLPPTAAVADAVAGADAVADAIVATDAAVYHASDDPAAAPSRLKLCHAKGLPMSWCELPPSLRG